MKVVTKIEDPEQKFAADYVFIDLGGGYCEWLLDQQSEFQYAAESPRGALLWKVYDDRSVTFLQLGQLYPPFSSLDEEITKNGFAKLPDDYELRDDIQLSDGSTMQAHRANVTQSHVITICDGFSWQARIAHTDTQNASVGGTSLLPYQLIAQAAGIKLPEAAGANQEEPSTKD
jgi:hypothetical protein